MSTASKWLIAIVVLLNLATAYLAMRVLAEYRQVRGQINTLEKQIAQETVRTKELAVGTPEAKGIALLRTDLHAVLTRRGRAWYNVAPSVQVDPQTNGIVVQVQLPEPFVPAPEEGAKGVLFAFEQDAPVGPATPEGEFAAEPSAEQPPPGAPRRYVGEFRIVGIQGNTVTMVPALALTQPEAQALLASQGPWTLYDVLPLDSHAALEDLDEAAIRALFHVDQREGPSREQFERIARSFVRDGKEAAPDDPPELVKDGKFERPLIDYGFLLRELDRQRTMLFDRMAATQAELSYLANSAEDSKRQEEFHRQEMTQLRERRQQLDRELAAINTLRESIASELNHMQSKIDQLLEENRALSSEVAAAQFTALRKAAEAPPYDADQPP